MSQVLLVGLVGGGVSKTILLFDFFSVNFFTKRKASFFSSFSSFPPHTHHRTRTRTHTHTHTHAHAHAQDQQEEQ
jgi:ABC-type nickel/cobalt efflux system permease component RcnA